MSRYPRLASSASSARSARTIRSSRSFSRDERDRAFPEGEPVPGSSAARYACTTLSSIGINAGRFGCRAFVIFEKPTPWISAKAPNSCLKASHGIELAASEASGSIRARRPRSRPGARVRPRSGAPRSAPAPVCAPQVALVEGHGRRLLDRIRRQERECDLERMLDLDASAKNDPAHRWILPSWTSSCESD